MSEQPVVIPLKKPCEHLWGLYKHITGNNVTQDYKCFHCGEVKRGLRS